MINERYVFGTEIEQIKYEQSKSKFQQQQATAHQSKSFHEDDEDIVNIEIPVETNRPLVKDLIVIDSPGFNDESNADPSKFQANVDVLDFFYQQSDMVLFFVSSDHMMSIGIALQLLQLTLLDPESKKNLMEQAKAQVGVKKTSGLIDSLIQQACKPAHKNKSKTLAE